MSAKENKATYLRIFEEATKGNLDAFFDALAPDCVIHHENPPPRTMSQEDFAQMMGDLATAFPDFRVVPEAVIAEDDMVSVLLAESGTMKGDFLGRTATGRHYEIPAIEMYRFEDGKIKEVWMVRNYESWDRQLGTVPPAFAGEYATHS
jgi:steroid delta-isomerase-like uncharacterized protein